MFELIDCIIVRPITNILFVIYGLVGDFGLAIILFTVLVKICIWPIMKRQMHQTKLMRKIQPELAEIKKNCNGNRQLESLQMMDLYKRNNIKPFRSILTVFIQLPIFIALYTAVRVMVLPTVNDNLERRAYAPVQQIERISEVVQLQQDYLYPPQPEPTEEAQTVEHIYNFHPKLFGFVDLDAKPGFTSWSAMTMLVFAFASAGTQYWVTRQQQPSKKDKNSKTFRQIMREAANGHEPDQSELNQVMSGQMNVMMPAMMLLIMINLPGALVFYYFVNNIFTVVQQRYVLNKKSAELDEVADKKILRELKRLSNLLNKGKKIQEAEIISSEPKESKDQVGKDDSNSSSNKHVTKITAKSSTKGRKSFKKKRS